MQTADGLQVQDVSQLVGWRTGADAHFHACSAPFALLSKSVNDMPGCLEIVRASDVRKMDVSPVTPALKKGTVA